MQIGLEPALMVRIHILMISILSALTVSLQSCNGMKQCTAPEVSIPETFEYSTSDSMSMADLEWWKFYGDSTLCRLISKSLISNKDAKIAATRVHEIYKLYNAGRTDFLPQLTANTYGSNETTNFNGSGTQKSREFGLKFNLNWEIDLFKRISWRTAKSKAEYMISVEDKRAVDVEIISEVAATYFELIALDNELEIVKQTLETRKESLDLAKLRYEGGMTSEMVYRQAGVEYADTRSLIPKLEERIHSKENYLNYLMGENPGGKISRPKVKLSEIVIEHPHVGIPSQILERRPDLRRSKQELASAMSDVGIAYADRFPSFGISLIGGFENDGLKKFFESPYTYAVGNIASTVFDFGKKKKIYAASIDAYEQARYRYERTVIQSFREVDDAIMSYRTARESAQRMTELRDEARQYAHLAYLQYISGSSLYLDRLDAERQLFDAQIELSNSVRDEYLSLVYLYKSLGGGWSMGSGTLPAKASAEL